MSEINYPSRKHVDNQRVAKSPGTPQNRDVNAATRAVTALSLRAQKYTYEAIAQQCGYASASACRKAILREMDRVVVTNVEHLRREELFILDKLHAECWEIAFDKKNKGRLFAIDRLIQISERRAKLMGLDTPVDSAVFANQIVIREVPQGLLGLESPKT